MCKYTHGFVGFCFVVVIYISLLIQIIDWPICFRVTDGPSTSEVTLNHYYDVLMGATASQITSLNRLFRHRSKKTSKLCVTGPCEGNSVVTGEFPAQRARNAEMFPFNDVIMYICNNPWWRHQMETFSALLALCAENSVVTGEFPSQTPATRSFDVFFNLYMNTVDLGANALILTSLQWIHTKL